MAAALEAGPPVATVASSAWAPPVGEAVRRGLLRALGAAAGRGGRGQGRLHRRRAHSCHHQVASGGRGWGRRVALFLLEVGQPRLNLLQHLEQTSLSACGRNGIPGEALQSSLQAVEALAPHLRGYRFPADTQPNCYRLFLDKLGYFFQAILHPVGRDLPVHVERRVW